VTRSSRRRRRCAISASWERFDSWFLALAAYNSGPARVSRVLRRHAPLAPRSDSLFWALREHFPRETREFLPKLYGAMRVAQAPEAHGYTLPPHDPWPSTR
jgi:membrane-bound lytic murein transglycosylase D